VRATPFALAFGEIAPVRFPLITEALQQDAIDPSDRDRFVLLEPVGRLLQEIVPEESSADGMEGHVLLLHHAYLFWASGQHVYEIDDAAVRHAVSEKEITTVIPAGSQYLQLPELRVWGSPNSESPPEPLDGMFVSRASQPNTLDLLAIFGLRPDRPGFSAVGVEGRADPDDPTAHEIEVSASREDGSAAFGPRLAGGSAAGLYSVANAGELLLLTGRLLALLDSRSSP
jgi:hypothetical protein